MSVRSLGLRMVLIAGLCVQTSAVAETRDECHRKIGKQTKIALGAGTGTVTGSALGASACAGFLGMIFADAGLSYAICVATVATAGAVMGTAIAEAHNNTQEQACDGKASEPNNVPKATKSDQSS